MLTVDSFSFTSLLWRSQLQRKALNESHECLALLNREEILPPIAAGVNSKAKGSSEPVTNVNKEYLVLQ